MAATNVAARVAQVEEAVRLRVETPEIPDRLTFARRYIPNLEPWQEQAISFTGSRAIWNCSRQSGKSSTAAIAATHVARYKPGALVLLVSKSERQSGELFRKVRSMYREIPDRPRLLEDNLTSMSLANGSRVVSLPSSEETIRGFSAPTLIICDEASRIPEASYMALTPMLSHGGDLILLSTPAGRRGRFWDVWRSDDPAWQRIQVTAAECSHVDPEFIESERRMLGDWAFRQEYECSFEAHAGAILDPDTIAAMRSSDVEPLPWSRREVTGRSSEIEPIPWRQTG